MLSLNRVVPNVLLGDGFGVVVRVVLDDDLFGQWRARGLELDVETTGSADTTAAIAAWMTAAVAAARTWIDHHATEGGWPLWRPYAIPPALEASVHGPPGRLSTAYAFRARIEGQFFLT